MSEPMITLPPLRSLFPSQYFPSPTRQHQGQWPVSPVQLPALRSWPVSPASSSPSSRASSPLPSIHSHKATHSPDIRFARPIIHTHAPAPITIEVLPRSKTPPPAKRDIRGPRPRKFPCPYCDAVFERPSSLRQHERTHTGDQPYRCDDCGKHFSISSNMRRHNRTCRLAIHHRAQAAERNSSEDDMSIDEGSSTSSRYSYQRRSSPTVDFKRTLTPPTAPNAKFSLPLVEFTRTSTPPSFPPLQFRPSTADSVMSDSSTIHTERGEALPTMTIFHSKDLTHAPSSSMSIFHQQSPTRISPLLVPETATDFDPRLSTSPPSPSLSALKIFSRTSESSVLP